MTCPKPEVLSQWADGSLNPHEVLVVGRHAETCPACRAKAGELRAVGAWIATAAVPGPSCLSAEDMAAVLEGGRVPAHVRTCPRCASEFRSLRQTERKATRRRQKPPAPMTAWAAAAAIFIAVGLLLIVANQQTSEPEPLAVRVPPKPQVVEPAPQVTPPTPPVVKPTPVIPESKPTPVERKPEPQPKPVERTPEPEPKPIVTEPPTPVVPKNPVRPTEVVETSKALAALNVRAGGLSSLTDGKWVKASKLEEGMALRADGRTQLDFAQARITLDGSSRFSVSKDEFALNDGGMSAEVAAGSKLVLVLEDQRLVPQASQSRVIFCARADRILVEEGAMKARDAFLPEGVEHLVKKDRIQPQARRTMPMAVRSRETVAWRMNLQNEVTVRYNINGHISRGAEGRFLASNALPPNDPFFYGVASYFSTGDEPPLFIAKPNTAVRFRYYMTQPGHLEFVMKNLTKDENFNRTLEPVVKQWTTVTLYARDVLANTGGKKVFYETGDVYRGVTWFVGRPGVPTEIYIDRFEILEIDR